MNSPYERFALSLDCARCGAGLQSNDVRADLGIATCRQCGAVLDLKGRLSELPAPQAAAPSMPALSAKPAHFLVRESPGAFEVSWRWFKPSVLGMLAFAVLWDGFLLVWYAGAARGGADLYTLLFPSLHIAAGVGITYSAIARLVNSTRLTIDRDALTVGHGPVPWLGGRRHPREHLSQLFVERTDRSGAKGRVTTAYDLCALEPSGTKRVLLKGLEHESEALWLERTLEHRLGIVPRHVAGAIGP